MDLSFKRAHILSCNQVFPEAASADPLQDLEEWDEWRNGNRQFPYPGIHSPLAIFSQPGKRTNPSAVGVIGEIFTGVLGQTGISPWVISRPIGSWPDFIFQTKARTFAFVESKASVNIGADARKTPDRALLREGLCDSLQELNSEPLNTVWLSFTEVLQIDPFFEVNVTFVEIEAPIQRITERGNGRAALPEVVVQPIAERVVSSAITNFLSKEAVSNEVAASSEEEVNFRLKVEPGLLPALVDLGNYDDSIAEATHGDDGTDDASPVVQIIDRAKKLLQKIKKKKLVAQESGKRLRTAKSQTTKGQLGTLRKSDEKSIYLVDLDEDSRTVVKKDFKPANWAASTQPLVTQVGDSELELWRCSGSAVGIGQNHKEGARIRIK